MFLLFSYLRLASASKSTSTGAFRCYFCDFSLILGLNVGSLG